MSRVYSFTQKGFTLIEVTSAMAIGLLVALSATRAVNLYLRSSDLDKSIAVIDMLRLSLQDYYYMHCKDTVFTQPTLSLLITDGVIPNKIDASNPFGSDYTLSINKTATPPTYRISTTIDSGESAEGLESLLKAQDRLGQEISWTGTITRGYGYGPGEATMRAFQRYYGAACQ